MENYLIKIQELAKPIVENHNLELVSVTKEKEFGVSIIRIIIDDPKTFNLDIDLVATINEEILDVINDYIPDNFYLEVSSLGIERELHNEEDYNKALNEYIYLSTYQKIPTALNLKEIYGYLKENQEENFVIESNIKGVKKILTVPKKDVAKIRLAVKM